jgi:UDP-glucose:(heptosyl)LPS alpha-1,3-glucosyltransferase
MACGTPVITTKMNGASEIIENGREGYVLKAGSADELSARIRDFLSVSDRSAMSQRAFEKAKTFTMENHIRQLFDLYGRVYKEKKK